MNKKISTTIQTVLALGAILGMITTVAAAPILPADSGTATTTTLTDPCGGGSGGAGWTAPGSTAPAGNVAAPINVSSTQQTKDGKLVLGNLPCPFPIGGWTPTSKLTVNGTTDTTGFSNWGASFLQGVVNVGAMWTRPAPFPVAAKAPKLFVQADALVGTPGPTNLAQPAAQFSGSVGILGTLGIVQNNGTVASTSSAGYNTIYVQGIPVCLKNGTDCPSASGAGIAVVVHDASLSGAGTSASPLSVVGGGSLTGSGTTNHLAKWTGSGLGDSAVTESAGDMSVPGRTTTDELFVGGATGSAAILGTNGSGLATWLPKRAIYEVDAVSCNAVSMQNSSTASDPTGMTGVEYFGSYTFPLRALTSYKYCYISSTFVPNTLIGYLTTS